MSIATEITRLQTAKADLKTAIEGKGVTVASDATLDTYAALVDSIETGGSSGGIKATTGTFTVSSDLSWSAAMEYSVSHDLGAVPALILIWTHEHDDLMDSGTGNCKTLMEIWIDKDAFNTPFYQASAGDTLYPFAGRLFKSASASKNFQFNNVSHDNITGLKYKPTTTEFHLIASSNYSKYTAGVTYHYLLVAGGWEES